MKNYLFICSANRDRSLTAEILFASKDGITCMSCGTNKDAATPVSADLLEWADVIFMMEGSHKKKVMEHHHKILSTKKVVVLGVPAKYYYMDEDLIRVLQQKMKIYL